MCTPASSDFFINPELTKLNMKLLSSKMIMALIIPFLKNSYNSFKLWQCDWKHSNTHVVTSVFFFGLENLKQMRKINIEREATSKERVKGRRKRENRKSEPKMQTSKSASQRNKLCFRFSASSKKHITKGNGTPNEHEA